VATRRGGAGGLHHEVTGVSGLFTPHAARLAVNGPLSNPQTAPGPVGQEEGGGGRRKGQGQGPCPRARVPACPCPCPVCVVSCQLSESAVCCIKVVFPYFV
jgi:hypothetical protein